MLRPSIALVAALVATPRLARAEVDVDDALYKCRQPPPSTKLSVSFRPETSLQDLATWATGFTCKNIIFSSDVAKRATRVTVISPNKMSPKQALALFVDAIEATGLVVVQKADTIIIQLGPNMPRSCPDVAGGELRGDPFSRDGGIRSTPPIVEAPPSEAELDDALAKGVRTIDATHIEITAELVDRILANPMAVAKGARVVPAMKDGKPSGFKLYAIRPGSVFARLGFQNGDNLKTINGLSLDSADKALEIYTKLREATSLEIELLRRGKVETLRITIKR